MANIKRLNLQYKYIVRFDSPSKIQHYGYFESIREANEWVQFKFPTGIPGYKVSIYSILKEVDNASEKGDKQEDILKECGH